MKKTYVAMMMAGLMGTGMMANTALAEELPMGITASGDIGIASQYVWRGVTQTAGKTAVQGDLGLALGGFSIGGWFSNAYPATAPQFAGRDVVEFDWTASYGGEIGDSGFSYSVGDILYTYLYDSASNFNEVNAGLSYGPVSLTGYYVTSDSKSKFYLAGDMWADLGVSGSLYGFDLSGTVSYAKWKKNATVRAIGATNTWKSGVNLITLGMSKGVTDNLSASLTATIPVAKKQPDGNRYIYGTAAKNEFVAALNMSY
ncbi:MAG: hypothetical protein COW19_02680 [Zetaproteobacteria bacterium CG12_big_fil_rev_8_21_14_0_65_55_1124]|nr:MAG: hypothetical protein AUJ58_08345 [Zetaproteobacteria bacterium CG1_02_55_237]PIS19725.1 MAG: hypothetical protein COT53_04185 [Zetaproteobacteria bacterium CG08_land_8_20_14_0_20_55_17]PIW43491.1 MAG: hypothetical protein COW19_02680 [Zetaproteobacteria bacterium CG12_big_fil_rev_8_21_14_0_65_55_1124]PIY54123.1 MAG: hypothetical protein COZ01_01460 [Zetaproteobacteria bacterium CG_4_10_14_0_8_um_filter_55_43]PIZ39116.1 MAG: hypothetical protein COY36_03940 [Zetaproteobacteria bacterium 